MKAIVLNQESFEFEVTEVDKPKVEPNEVLIKLKASAINHHELWSLQDKNIKSNSDIILGSDGSGIIEQVGSLVNNFKKDDEVILNPSLNWGTSAQVQDENYEILGFPTQGTFAEYICLDQQYIHLKPKHLSFQEAAAIPLGGLTAYRALFSKGKIESNHKILITGIGGGAALFAFNFAKAIGAEIYVTSGTQDKLSKAIDLGAKAGVNYKDKSWETELKNEAKGFDIIIDSAAGAGFSHLTDLAKPGGRIVLFGRTAGNIPHINPKTIFWKQLTIYGSTMGSTEEFKKMINLIESKEIRPVIDSIYAPNEINIAFSKMKKTEQFGKIVIDLEKF